MGLTIVRRGALSLLIGSGVILAVVVIVPLSIVAGATPRWFWGPAVENHLVVGGVIAFFWLCAICVTWEVLPYTKLGGAKHVS